MEAEEQLLALSERGSSIASGSYKSKSISSRRVSRNFNVSAKQCSKSITIDSPAEVGFSLRDKQSTNLSLRPLLDIDEEGPSSAKDGRVGKNPYVNTNLISQLNRFYLRLLLLKITMLNLTM